MNIWMVFTLNNEFSGSKTRFLYNNLIILSSRGIIAYEHKDEKNKKYFKQIKIILKNF